MHAWIEFPINTIIIQVCMVFVCTRLIKKQLFLHIYTLDATGVEAYQLTLWGIDLQVVFLPLYSSSS